MVTSSSSNKGSISAAQKKLAQVSFAAIAPNAEAAAEMFCGRLDGRLRRHRRYHEIRRRGTGGTESTD